MYRLIITDEHYCFLFFIFLPHYVAVRREIVRNLEFCTHPFVKEHFQEIGTAALLLGMKPRHVEKLRECWLTDVGESELTHE